MKTLLLLNNWCVLILIVLSLAVPAGGQNVAVRAPRVSLPATVAPGAKLRVIHQDKQFFEGPAWDQATRSLYFTAFAGQVTEIRRLDERGRVSTWMRDTAGINGMRLSRDGRLLGAQAFGHKLLSLKIGAQAPDEVKTLADGYEGRQFNQPNDLAEAPNGDVYFTDPDFEGKAQSAVYCLRHDGKLSKIITNLKVPNGVLVSADGLVLYVGDSFERRIYAYPISADGSVKQGEVKVFFDPATPNQNAPDGMCADEGGNLYFAMRGGVWAVSTAGRTLGLIPVPEFASNVAFGGTDGKTLYITCDGKVYALAMNVRGENFLRK